MEVDIPLLHLCLWQAELFSFEICRLPHDWRMFVRSDVHWDGENGWKDHQALRVDFHDVQYFRMKCDMAAELAEAPPNYVPFRVIMKASFWPPSKRLPYPHGVIKLPIGRPRIEFGFCAAEVEAVDEAEMPDIFHYRCRGESR